MKLSRSQDETCGLAVFEYVVDLPMKLITYPDYAINEVKFLHR